MAISIFLISNLCIIVKLIFIQKRSILMFSTNTVNIWIKNCMGMVCSLHHKVHKIRSNHQLLMTQIYLEKFVSWSGYCHYGYYKLGLKINQSMVIIKKRINQHFCSKIFYTGAQGDRLHKHLTKNLIINKLFVLKHLKNN